MSGQAWVYILQCADGSYYVGSTRHLEKRVGDHNAGLGGAYTRPARRRPVRLLWATQFARIDDAFRFEKKIQGWSRAKREALMEGRFDDLPALPRNRQVAD